ncbi:MAG: DNAase [Gallionellales bacterium 35-53-114]|jgi:TatD DNase family protein|nr:MAG: DNAase [Gallionellales bacterium 35-53-114]OYZ63039.1 MAG: DNAase [Gallionellales bacterium 24-53-125]OZB08979.1 MAG: DNAase [Gallionellales bacterium 39-52-133]HQS59344.1 TatD family hydrolase [Gallionellaceae bacterium]HQS76257.1 TatD family hydrolase [Gallionellaceae bacterium]
MFIDSHCHINFPELADNIDEVLATMRTNQVSDALCVSVDLEKFPQILALAEQHDNIYASVGVHPDYELETEPTQEELVRLARHPKVIAIGETGLDYFRLTGDLEWQRTRFRTHIRAAVESGKPLIIHTRSASADTLRLMQEEGADKIGGVMHCFTESLEVALAAIEMNFYISFSGIVTFKKALELKEVATRIPLERMLIETDSPYLAPVPFRGKLNQPGYVKHVAEEIAKLRGISVEEVGLATSVNFYKLFNINK